MIRTWSVRPATLEDAERWGALRLALWPDEPDCQDVRPAFGRDGRAAAFLAVDDTGNAIGFSEATLRSDYVNGTTSSPVGFLEGWYVTPGWRGNGIGRALTESVEEWARVHGCSEFASDALLDNPEAHAAHRACGFEETERVVCFRKCLDR
ncbi:MAG: aminoglycoside 6'-N-acetyltransferase [Lysobacteraceae bacterium]